MSGDIQLHIPEPCHENWQLMTPVEQGRFCAVCSKQVTDFSGMNDRELAMFFKKHAAEKICGRFRNDQIDRDLEVPQKRIPWIRYFFTVALPSLLFTMKTKAQGQVLVNLKEDQLMALSLTYRPAPLQPAGHLKWMDFMNEPQNIQRPIPAEPNAILKPDTFFRTIILGGVVSVRRKRKHEAIHKDVTQSSAITTKPAFMKQEFFKVYPDPVSAGGEIHLMIADPVEGYFQYTIISADGRVLTEDKIWMDTKARMINLAVPETVPGIYFITLVNTGTGQKFTERFLVQ